MALRTLLDGLKFPEGPRWRDGKLWFSDMHDLKVCTVDLDGRKEVVAEVPGQPSGLGWTPDGDLLVVSMTDRRLLRLPGSDPGSELVEVADLSGLATYHCNDMVVDEQGRAYVGNFGSEFLGGTPPVPAVLALVTPDGEVRAAAKDLQFPNGTVITPDGRTLIVGETWGARMTAFDIEDDGSLANRRTWATLEGALPDGCCLDAEGAIWIASPVGHRVLRVAEGGEVLETLEVAGQEAFACMLGGPEGRNLFVLTAGSPDPEVCRANPDAQIRVVEVDVPHAGLP